MKTIKKKKAGNIETVAMPQALFAVQNLVSAG